MASTTDPRAAGFDAAKFRDAVSFAMSMGASNEPDSGVIFRFKADKTYTSADDTGLPYDWTATPQENPVPADVDVTVPVAMEFVARSSQARDTSMGHIQPSHVELTILDTYIDEVRGADEVLIDGNTYIIVDIAPPVGLFGVDVWSILAQAVDES